MSDSLVIHIGMPKCASTWLQKKLFTDEFGFFNIEAAESGANLSRGDFLRQIIPEDSPYFNKNACQHQLDEHLNQITPADELIPVFSHERLVGTQFFGSYDREMIAQRLHSAFPQAKILILIREQLDMLDAHYKQYIKGGGVLKLKDYLDQQWRGPYMPRFNREQFDYFKLISLYQSLFGSEQVLFLPYELLLKEPEVFISQLFDFATIKNKSASPPLQEKVNTSLTHANIWWLRKLNHIIGRPKNFLNLNALIRTRRINKLAHFLNLPRPVDKRIKRRHKKIIKDYIQAYYSDSNRQLQELTSINLSELGYPLSKS